MNAYEVWRRRTIGVVRTQRVSVLGLEFLPTTGAAILAPNHLNWKDVFFLSAMVPRQIHYVGAYELFDTRRCYEYVSDYMMQRLGHWFKLPAEFLSRYIAGIISHRVRAVGAIPVKRGGSVKEMFESVKNVLKKEKLICIFPEGGTGKEGRLLKFKRGISKIVYDLWEEGHDGISVLPAAIQGTNRFLLPKRSLSIQIAAPLFIEDHLGDSPKETMIRFTERLWKEVSCLLSET